MKTKALLIQSLDRSVDRSTQPTRAAQIIEAYAREIPFNIHKVRFF